MKKIWIIDDDETYSFICQTLLIRAGWAPKAIALWHSGGAALAHLRTHANNPSQLADLILLDLNMPYMDGWMFIEHFRTLTLPSSIPIHIQSSSVSTEDQERAKGYPEIAGYIIKPFDLQGAQRLHT